METYSFDERGAPRCWTVEMADAGFPSRLFSLGRSAPARVYIWGALLRFSLPQCAVIGSRKTSPGLCAAAGRLALALGRAGVCVTSGLAVGADSAAHEGACRGPVGTVAVPAMGIGRLPERAASFLKSGGMTLLSLAPPEASFSPGLAIRRNHAIAALSGGVVLVASGLKGGSAHALRWALGHGRPVWAFELGRATPPGNASLLRSGLAKPLSIKAAPGQWAETIKQGLARRPPDAQADWVSRPQGWAGGAAG